MVVKAREPHGLDFALCSWLEVFLDAGGCAQMKAFWHKQGSGLCRKKEKEKGGGSNGRDWIQCRST